MQCDVCRAVYSASLDACPRCRCTANAAAPASEKSAPAAERRTATRAESRTTTAKAASKITKNMNDTTTSANATATQPPAPSTLIEFPGTSRASRPQWRKDLSERVREIQQRRAREAAQDGETTYGGEQTPAAAPSHHVAAPRPSADDVPAPSLGLVPPCADAPPMNPLVVAALRRIERARQPLASANPSAKSRTTSGGAATATAVAYVAEEQYQTELQIAPAVLPPTPAINTLAPEATKTESTAEAARTSGLVVLATPLSAKAEQAVEASKVGPAAKTTTDSPALKTGAEAVGGATQVETEVEKNNSTKVAASHIAGASANVSTKPRRVIPGVLDELSLDRREAAITDAANFVPVVERYNDHAPRVRRLVAGVIDLLLVSFCALPFAAIIELTSGNWSDPRVVASMCGIILLVMFLYFVVSTGLLGRTPAMRLLSLRAVDARNALVPTTEQSTRRTLFYMLSLATFGLGIIYALFDAEGRTAHDHLSGTIVVSE